MEARESASAMSGIRSQTSRSGSSSNCSGVFGMIRRMILSWTGLTRGNPTDQTIADSSRRQRIPAGQSTVVTVVGDLPSANDIMNKLIYPDGYDVVHRAWSDSDRSVADRWRGRGGFDDCMLIDDNLMPSEAFYLARTRFGEAYERHGWNGNKDN